MSVNTLTTVVNKSFPVPIMISNISLPQMKTRRIKTIEIYDIDTVQAILSSTV